MSDLIERGQTPAMRGLGTLKQRLWGERRDLGDERPGYWPGSRREWGVLLAVVIVSVVLFAVVGALTTLSDRPGLEAWKGWTWALTSGAASLPCVFLCMVAARRASLAEWGWPRAIGLHAAAALIYAIFHVSGFVLLRNLVYAAMGDDYGMGPLLEDFPYELRKDLLSYGINVAVFLVAGQAQRRRRGPRDAQMFDIRDGSRLVRVPVREIRAVSSAGNYVEFWLADGRRPLMRTTLAAIEARLEPAGFVRPHRSWLVNAEAVTGLRPDGSGDWTVELGEVQVPLSRRYPQALARLRG